MVCNKGKPKNGLYIGEAGKKSSLIQRGTLFRGISELQRNTFSSNSPDYNVLDTDFIVGTAIMYCQKLGYQCIWRHLHNDPSKENEYVASEKPFLQDVTNTRIRKEFKLRKPVIGYWKRTEEKINEAERELFILFSKSMR